MKYILSIFFVVALFYTFVNAQQTRGAGRNGLYTQELLKQMKTSGLGIEDVFKRVRISVRGATAERQTPWESSSLTGDFYFSGNASSAINAPLIERPTVQPQTTYSQSTVQPTDNSGSSAEEVLARRTKSRELVEKANQSLFQGISQNYPDVVEAALREGADLLSCAEIPPILLSLRRASLQDLSKYHRCKA